MKQKRFYVDHFIYFGTIDRNEFETQEEMYIFIRQLRPGALLACTADKADSRAASESEDLWAA